MADPHQNSGPIQSQFANDPDMKELVELFISELPQRIDAINTAFQAGDTNSLKRLAHQLRGASAGYGYPTLGTAAGAVEDGLRSLAPTETSRVIARLGAEVAALIDMCRRASAA